MKRTSTPDGAEQPSEAMSEFRQALGEIGSDLDRAQTPLDSEQLFSELHERINNEERNPLSKLRSQPTWLRRAIAFGVIAVIVVIAGPLAPRADISSYPAVRMALHVGALVGLGGLCAWVALRPLHVPAWSPMKCWAAVGLAMLCTFVLCVLPQIESTAVGSASGCLTFGSLLSLPVFVLLRLLDRGAVLSAVLGGTAGGLAGNVALQLHCPVTDRGHLLAGHFPVLVAFVFIGLGVWLGIQRHGRA